MLYTYEFLKKSRLCPLPPLFMLRDALVQERDDFRRRVDDVIGPEPRFAHLPVKRLREELHDLVEILPRRRDHLRIFRQLLFVFLRHRVDRVPREHELLNLNEVDRFRRQHGQDGQQREVGSIEYFVLSVGIHVDYADDFPVDDDRGRDEARAGIVTPREGREFGSVDVFHEERHTRRGNMPRDPLVQIHTFFERLIGQHPVVRRDFQFAAFLAFALLEEHDRTVTSLQDIGRRFSEFSQGFLEIYMTLQKIAETDQGFDILTFALPRRLLHSHMVAQ